MLALATLALFIAAAVGQPSLLPTLMRGAPIPASTDTPKPCCIPEKWEAVVIDLESYAQYHIATTTVFDYSKKMQGSFSTSTKTGEPVAHSLIDYTNQVIYNAVFVPGPTPTCTKSPYLMPMTLCLNETGVKNLTFTGSSTLGPMQGGLKYDSWSFLAGDFQIAMAATRLDSSDLCSPVLESVTQVGKTQRQLFMFLDVTTTIKDEGIVTIPASCKHLISDL